MHKTYMGMDIHKNFIQAIAMDEKGNILQEKRFSSDLQDINDFIQKLNSKDIQAAIESTYTLYYIYEKLKLIKSEKHIKMSKLNSEKKNL